MVVKDESGYTLVESLVAMTLFVTVVLGLIGSIGYSAKFNDASYSEQAFSIAREEIIKSTKEMPESSSLMVGSFQVDKSVKRMSNAYSLTVTVFSPRNSELALISLTKIIPVYAK